MIDVLIVGAGSAGAVIANRVSEDPNRSVRLIEAGPDYPELSQTPFDLINSHNNSYTAHDWGHRYEPTREREVIFPRGRVTGGSSAVNTTIALRGMPEDYDEWARLGCDGWSWTEVLPAFNRLERDLDYGDKPYHGDAGPITIRRYPADELEPQQAAFLTTADQLGYPDCPDANDPDGWGAGPHPMNKLGRLRISTAIGYLAPARLRPNLTIQADTLVRRVLFQGSRATGVEVENADGSIETINARLVVLCAGAIKTPQILMLSGIGPKAQLEAFGIESVTDEPGVGQNLSDHPALSVVCEVKDGVLIDHDRPIIQTILRYTAEGSDKRNDLQIEQISFAGKPNGPALFSIAAVLEYQYGRGELRLQSSDPSDHPIIDARFCEDDRDTSRLVGCMKDTLAFARTGELGDMIKTLSFPDPARGVDDEKLAALCKKFAGSGYHPCGTVKMGDKTDPMAVVDENGFAHRLENLVVADASIMPFVPRANTNLTCIMIGEKIGERLRRGH
ncbi:MAG: GMC family oxidoreductase N-terminal domain-containing protein [Pseudomonadales bacterium]|nr:GMC family oxidoreductase N-terminal domain-containing protein [Pseudomonadales bacterium]MBO6703209.1 GMC family oxidoreductase N-terminal domain-containing protein [Pseudomonadales bacterium]MBO7006213.1 GMC family oxidoreductase N-terminal domain-containing protein [Pseudomonadales bacterium]